MPPRKRRRKHLHPFISYAFLFGVGAIAVSTTANVAGPGVDDFAELPPPIAIAAEATRHAAPQDLGSLKAAAAEFAGQLAIIKSQIAELESYGHFPPAALTDAIGEGEQLTALIADAQTIDDIGEDDPAGKLRAIGRRISENAKF